jgi:hypothetical protein
MSVKSISMAIGLVLTFGGGLGASDAAAGAKINALVAAVRSAVNEKGAPAATAVPKEVPVKPLAVESEPDDADWGPTEPELGDADARELPGDVELENPDAAEEGQRGMRATCYGRVMAQPLSECGGSAEVAKFQKGGYTFYPLCTPKCQDYARGTWDAYAGQPGQPQFIAWAKQVAQCGKVKLMLRSACGSGGYGPELRQIVVDLGGKCVYNCYCTPGYTNQAALVVAGQRIKEHCRRAICPVPGVPNQVIAPTVYIYNGMLFHIGERTCKWECQP